MDSVRGKDCRKTETNACTEKGYLKEISFTQCINKYKGKTVTVFVATGGETGLGFTGVLMGVFGSFIKLCGEEAKDAANDINDGIGHHPIVDEAKHPTQLCSSLEPKTNSGVNQVDAGSVADIPLNKVTAIVHSTV